ncbi:MAG: class I SAM-dependent methyltransferase [Thermoplasmatales archaeon]|nr:class I SAM-dependent methyltransferase [Candidatus Thermoplasmatota archaeon]MDA8054396.1 class I SAM-dependent methyltransferase [Thermoplasmatales archaeon]
MRQEQRKSWNREYRLRGKLWRGELKEKDIFEENLVPGMVLDNGCGNGKGTPKIPNVIGMDFSIFALSLYGSNTKVLGDMVHLPFKDSTFSNILFIHSLDHLNRDERDSALQEAGRVLKEDGIVIARVFSRMDFRYRKGHEIEEGTFLRGNRIQTHYFEKEEFSGSSVFKVSKTYDINYTVNIQNKKYNRREFIIILTKSKSGNIR